MTRPSTHAETVLATERRARAVELRLAGYSLKQIGAELGVTFQAVAKMINKELSELRDVAEKDAEILREVEVARLDAMLKAKWPEVEIGNDAAIDRVLRIMERRAKLLGLDAPTRSNVEANIETGSTLSVHLMDNGRFPKPSGD